MTDEHDGRVVRRRQVSRRVQWWSGTRLAGDHPLDAVAGPFRLTRAFLGEAGTPRVRKAGQQRQDAIVVETRPEGADPTDDHDHDHDGDAEAGPYSQV